MVTSQESTQATKRYRAKLYGDFALYDDQENEVTPARRKSRALLAYLILSAQAAVPRNHLAALLWSDRGEDQARASLRQALYEIRDLAPLVAADRVSVRIDRTMVRTDLGSSPTDMNLLANLNDVDKEFDAWLAIQRTLHRDVRAETPVLQPPIDDDPQITRSTSPRSIFAVLIAVLVILAFGSI